MWSSPGDVSILTRPEERVLLCKRSEVLYCFAVSILTRPEERVLRATQRNSQRVSKREFQSSPALKSGCYAVLGRVASDSSRPFQSSPALKSGCYVSARSVQSVGEFAVSILTRPEERVLQ